MEAKQFKYFLFLLFINVVCVNNIIAQTVTGYARQGDRVYLELEWNAGNYGSIQWQQSTDDGANWTNIRNATTPFYELTVSKDAYIRAKVDAQEVCEPFYATRIIKTVSFSAVLNNVGANSAEFNISNIDFGDAEIVEYGFCYNMSTLNSRGFTDLFRVKINESYPHTSSFTMLCEDLTPNTNYTFRIYFRTADGSMLFSPTISAKTLTGVKWSSEDWTITKTEISARFLIDGASVANDKIAIKYGTSTNNLTSITFSKNTNNTYSSELINNLQPNTNYIFQLEVQIGSRTDVITKNVKTLSDYSSFITDPTTKKVQNTIEWDKTKTLKQISPIGLQAEYPRIIRVSKDTLLCSYHGGNDNDYWINIYLQKSYDNGKTWTNPTKLLDKENSSFGQSYWRFVNPEMIKLQNGWIVMSFVGNGKPETNENCHVMVIVSKDNGETWSDPKIVGRGRTWEPMVVQLPNGELELLVASEAAWWGGSTIHQEILCSRSTDNGETWTAFKRAAYSPNRRDGMPVATVMQGNKGVLFAIEIVNDQGWGSPTLVKRDLNGEWDANPWSGSDTSRRWRANMGAHGGAPYILQLPTGEIVVSAHTHGGAIWQTSTPTIIIGDNNGKNFTSPVKPITNLPTNQGLYYNSMFLKDNETVWLVMTHSTYDGTKRVKGEIRYLEGKIVSAETEKTLTLTNLKKISRVTGKSLEGEKLPNPNNTHILYGLSCTDLGVIWEIEPGKIGLFFGDSFGGDFVVGPDGGPNNGNDWRSNVLAFSENTTLNNGIIFSGMALDPYNSRRAREIIPRWGYKSFTSIPTAAIEVKGVQYVHFMNFQVMGGDEHLNYSSIYRSVNKGLSWISCESKVKFPANSYFGQIGYAKRDGYVYMVGTPIGRSGSARLARFLEEDILNYNNYEYWNGSLQRWIKGNESQATVILDGTVGELSVMYLEQHKKWIVLYFDADKYAICYRTAKELNGAWSAERTLATGRAYPQLYGSYMHPHTNNGANIYFTMSQWQPYNVFLMRADITL